MKKYVKIIGASGILFFILLTNVRAELIQPKTVKFGTSEPVKNKEDKYLSNPYSFPAPKYPEGKMVIPEVKIKPAEISADLFLREDNLLSQQIESWAKSKGYKLLWKGDKDYLIYKDIYIHGKNDQEVLGNLGNLLSSQTYNLNIKLYKRNNVIVIEEN
ncbi:TcpQ domain-containing protein [Morganella sp. EGD-HP17]|uniref:TcpQ domain-containing protein n=1 Tax=Morganella sp. EGD-HP17 TaxID=1435146 RepID=UPI00044719D1|nr:TcpQ domain-containing protein [Morganella sp. EGD-HP17]ETO41263.1 hypothetical protein X965_11080 [Morganella sp. EGD-HP17]